MINILFLSLHDKRKQGDYLDITIMNGFRQLENITIIDFPRINILYNDFSEIKKEDLHGRGFSIISCKVNDIDNKMRINIFDKQYDAIIIGDKHIYGEYINDNEIKLLKSICNNNLWFLDGNDLMLPDERIEYQNILKKYKPCFKREIISPEIDIYPIGFGIDSRLIMNIELNKNQLYQKTAPGYALFQSISYNSYIFNDENEYYKDMQNSWFGLTCKKGGWDCMRHYEILAAGSLLLFRDYDKKPYYCSPINMPCFSYSSLEELDYLMSDLVVDNKPTEIYKIMLYNQRKWLLENATTKKRAENVLKIIIS